MHNFFTHDFAREAGEKRRRCLNCGDEEPQDWDDCRECPGRGLYWTGFVLSCLAVGLVVAAVLCVLFS